MSARTLLSRMQLLILGAVMLSSCVLDLATEQISVGEVVARRAVARPPDVVAWSAPVAVDLGDASLWVFDRVVLSDGSELAMTYALVTADSAWGEAPIDLARDASGRPRTLVEGRADEVLVPLGGFASSGVGHLYYQVRSIEGPPRGVGLCTLDAARGSCERLRAPTVSGEVFDTDVVPFDQGGLVMPDGLAYLVGCVRSTPFDTHCVLARVPPTEAANGDAYRWWNAFDGWAADPAMATSIVDGAGRLSIAPEATGALVRWTLPLYERTVRVESAAAPEGPYGTRLPAVDIEGDPALVAGGPLVLSSLSRGDGSTTLGIFDGAELSLLAFRLRARLP